LEINGQVKDGEYNFTRLWNSESRFVVAGAKKYSMLQQTAIFDYFSNLRIYNCIIVCQAHEVMDIERSKPNKVNDIDTDMKLGVYTWFPYQGSDRCTEVKDIKLLDSWVHSAQGYFKQNNDFFPIKIRNSFNRCPMKVVARNGYGFVTTYYLNDHVSSESDIKGLEIDLLRIILKQINMTFVHVPTPEGFELENGSVNNLISAMISKEAYIAVGGVKKNFCITHHSTSPIAISPQDSACIYRVL
jgi:hypothetical protein